MSIFGCNHKYGLVDEKGYQYCIHCNKAVFVGLPPCQHFWLPLNTLKHSNRFSAYEGLVYIRECKHCGDLKRFSTKDWEGFS